jgi:hypothetical protein
MCVTLSKPISARSSPRGHPGRQRPVNRRAGRDGGRNQVISTVLSASTAIAGSNA